MTTYAVCWECIGDWYANSTNDGTVTPRERGPVRGDTLAIVGEEYCEGHPAD